MWVPDVDVDTILLALTVSSATQTPKAFAALGGQVIPRLGGGVRSVSMHAWKDLIRHVVSGP